MAHPHTPLILLILVCSLWLSDGTTCFTDLGTKCIEDCKLDDGVYKCKTIDKDGKYQTMNCSPQENMDSQDIQYTAPSGYCGQVMDEMIHYGSNGGLCYGKCDKGYFNYWCNTAERWEYCSPSENRDCKNRPCKKDSPCGNQGESYDWCWLEEGSWDYCGQVISKENHYGSNDQSTYDYHGHIEEEEDNCTYSNLRDTTTQCREGTDTQMEGQVICTCYDKGNKKKTTFTAVPTPDYITDGSQWRKEAENLISLWDNGYLVDQQRSNLLHSDNLRIDMHGFVQQRYYNLQIQVNISPGESTSVSQIFVTDGIPDRYIRRAFLDSFRHRARVFVEVEAHQHQSPVLEMSDP